MRIAVIGAGAAGLMAAAVAAQRLAAIPGSSGDAPRQVIVFEKNRKAGVKILMSGGTRCNLTHDCGPAGIMEAFGKGGQFLRQALAALPPSQVVALFHSLGVPTQIEVTGKIFPSSNRALDVRDALLGYAERSGAEVRLATPVRGIVPGAGGQGIVVSTDEAQEKFDAVIVTVGGKSWPGCGTTGDGYGWLRGLGHTLVPPRPALVPLVGGEAWMNGLSGLTLDDVTASVWAVPGEGMKRPKKPSLSRRGGFLFTHFGFSGPTAMDVSGVMTSAERFDQCRLSLDFAPDVTPDQLTRWFEEQRRESGARRVAAAVTRWLPKRLAESVAEVTGSDQRTMAELPRAQTVAMVEAIKNLTLPVTGTRGFDKAEVTAGGVSLKEVDPRTMRSRLVPRLYIAGEILDLDGWIGGYNFQSAFSTGFLAGTHAADQVREAACLT